MKSHLFHCLFLFQTIVCGSSVSAFQFSGKDSIVLREVFLDSVQVGSELKIRFHASVGCITLHDIDVSIHREKKRYVATATYKFEAGNGDNWRKSIKRKVLSEAQVDTLRQLEIDMINAVRANDVVGSILVPGDCYQNMSTTFQLRRRKKTYDLIACEVGEFTRFTEVFFGKVW